LRKAEIFHLPFDVCHLSLEENGSAMTNVKRQMVNGKSLPSDHAPDLTIADY
jgi:hypothetical protein